MPKNSLDRRFRLGLRAQADAGRFRRARHDDEGSSFPAFAQLSPFQVCRATSPDDIPLRFFDSRSPPAFLCVGALRVVSRQRRGRQAGLSML